jgi:hypothetical protein
LGVTVAVVASLGLVAAGLVGIAQASSTPQTVSFFSASDVPTVKADPDHNSVELGMRFSSSVAGSVTAVRFWKGTQDTGTHVGHLWTSNGIKLASVTFANETASGWQQASFGAPVKLSAGSVYTVSYFAPHGGYGVTERYFNSARTSGPLTAPSRRNGVYAYGSASGFPTKTYNASNYYVDVVFQPDGLGTVALPTSTSAAPAPAVSASPTTAASASPTAATATATPTPVATQTTAAPAATQSSTATAPAGVTGCISKPSTCGYPDATNTGVPAGTALKRVPQDVTSGPGWAWDSRGWFSVTTNNAVISGLDISGNLDVNGFSGVTIKNTIVRVGSDDFGISARHTTNLLVEDTTVVGSSGVNRALVGFKDIYGDDTGTVLQRLDISGVATGVQMDSGLLRDSYIHDMGYRSGDHTNGTTSNSGGDLLTIDHNTILNAQDQTDAVSLFEDFGAQYNRVISNNLLAGGGYSIYGGANSGGQPTSNIKITNNRISTVYYPKGGYYGPLAAFDSSGSGNVWSGNVWDSTGASIG